MTAAEPIDEIEAAREVARVVGGALYQAPTDRLQLLVEGIRETAGNIRIAGARNDPDGPIVALIIQLNMERGSTWVEVGGKGNRICTSSAVARHEPGEVPQKPETFDAYAVDVLPHLVKEARRTSRLLARVLVEIAISVS